MSSNIQGMDTEYAREMVRGMKQNAGQMAGVLTSVSGIVQRAKQSWTGPDAEAFVNDWDGQFAPQAQGAVDSVDEQAGVLARHADRQDAASA